MCPGHTVTLCILSKRPPKCGCRLFGWSRRRMIIRQRRGFCSREYFHNYNNLFFSTFSGSGCVADVILLSHFTEYTVVSLFAIISSKKKENVFFSLFHFARDESRLFSLANYFFFRCSFVRRLHPEFPILSVYKRRVNREAPNNANEYRTRLPNKWISFEAKPDEIGVFFFFSSYLVRVPVHFWLNSAFVRSVFVLMLSLQRTNVK